MLSEDNEYTPPPWHPSSTGLSPDPKVTEQQRAMVYTISLGKQGKSAYSIGSERRVYTIGPQTPEKKKGRFLVRWWCILLPSLLNAFREIKDTAGVYGWEFFQESLATGSSKVTSCGFGQKRVLLSDLLEQIWEGVPTVLPEAHLNSALNFPMLWLLFRAENVP